MLKFKCFVAVACLALSACSYIGDDLKRVQDEEVDTLLRLPCKSIGQSQFWDRNDHSFLCNMAEWGSVTYALYEGDEVDDKIDESVLLWKEYDDNSFFSKNREDAEIALGRLSDRFALNNRLTMLGFASSLNNYTFYTEYLKIKHTTDYYQNTPEPYHLHKVSFKSKKR